MSQSHFDNGVQNIILIQLTWVFGNFSRLIELRFSSLIISSCKSLFWSSLSKLRSSQYLSLWCSPGCGVCGSSVGSTTFQSVSTVPSKPASSTLSTLSARSPGCWPEKVCNPYRKESPKVRRLPKTWKQLAMDYC